MRTKESARYRGLPELRHSTVAGPLLVPPSPPHGSVSVKRRRAPDLSPPPMKRARTRGQLKALAEETNRCNAAVPSVSAKSIDLTGAESVPESKKSTRLPLRLEFRWQRGVNRHHLQPRRQSLRLLHRSLIHRRLQHLRPNRHILSKSHRLRMSHRRRRVCMTLNLLPIHYQRNGIGNFHLRIHLMSP
ncbi:unnamed protein product [Arabis nemorensis]|uniref:Uncharacterized protein n=1 Tax=Arabis nemorensis TaxID=586526 RepID=A0A565CM78_9BRAS|nr:unnamed protein product [Arabis nemorensis]